MEGKNGIISLTFFLNDPAAEANADKQLHGLEMTILGPLSLQTIKKDLRKIFASMYMYMGVVILGFLKKNL